jgi:hypothetical protein
LFATRGAAEYMGRSGQHVATYGTKCSLRTGR